MIKNIIKTLLAFTLIGFLVHSSLLNLGLLTVLVNKPGSLLFIFSLMIIVLMLSSWRWFRLNSTQNFAISYRDTMLSTYIGLTFNNILPGGVSGDIVRVNYLFKRVPHKKIAGALSILTDRIIGLLGVIFTTCIIGLVYRDLFRHSEFLSLFLNLSSYIAIAVIVGYGLLFLMPDSLGMTERLQKRFANSKIAELFMVIKIFKKSPAVLIECVAVSVLIQIIIVYTLVLISRVLDFVPINSLHYAIANMVTQFMNLVPISPGGVGVGEMAFAKVITLLDPTVAAAYATIYLAYRILNIVFCMLGIGIYFKNNIFNKMKLVENGMFGK